MIKTKGMRKHTDKALAGKTADWLPHGSKPVYPRWVASGDVRKFPFVKKVR